jgi:hypothetical protein
VKYLLTFQSTHLALKVEAYLKRDQVPFKLRMKPRTISADCGLAMDILPENLPRALDSLARRSVTEFAVYRAAEGKDDWQAVPAGELPGAPADPAR